MTGGGMLPSPLVLKKRNVAKMKTRELKNIRIEERSPTVEEYQSLKHYTNWEMVEDSDVRTDLDHGIYSVVAYDGPNLVGMGRVVGDLVSYFYVEDIIVHPKHLRIGVGGLILSHIEHYIESIATRYAYIGLIATKGTKEFYKKYGFIERKSSCQGMFKVLKARIQ